MNAKTNPLADAMHQLQEQDLPKPVPVTRMPTTKKASKKAAPAAQAPSRDGKVAMTCYYSREVRTQMKMLAIDQDKTMQTLFDEALNDLFRKYNKSAIS